MARRPLHRVQAVSAARRYFIPRQTKSQIAEELGISRFRVARLIDAPIEEGIIQFVISEPSDLNTELGDAVRRAFGLSRSNSASPRSKSGISRTANTGSAPWQRARYS